METGLWNSPPPYGPRESPNYCQIHRHVQIKQLLRIMDGLKCALHHSILNSVKLFFGMNVQG